MFNFDLIKSELSEEFDLIEIKRHEFKKKRRILMLVFVLLAIIAFTLTTLFTTNFLFGAFPTLILLTIFFALNNFFKKKVASLFKLKILVPAIQKGFPNLSYQSSPGINREDFLASTLYSSGQIDRYVSEDIFEGKHGETQFRFCEVHAERKEETRSNGSTSTRYVTVFQGIFMIADFNKSLSHTTRIVQGRDGFFEKLFNRKTKVSLENPDFEGLFNTYCDDQIEARYILSPAMMERILKLQSLWEDKVSLSFCGNHIYIAINHARNLFEAELGDPMEMEQVERIFKEISACLRIIDTLDLNTRIWTKE